MMSFYYLSFLVVKMVILLNNRIDSVHSTCPTTLTCLNHGTFDSTSCTCKCLLAYTGTKCEYVSSCVSDPAPFCGGLFTSSQCPYDQLVTAFCPVMCKSDICPCTFNSCENYGIFDKNSCSCRCLPNYSGNRCELLNCNANDPSVCANYSSNCADPVISSYCPHTCGQCCQNPLTCQNSGFFDKTSCSCKCLNGYKGTLCETLSCTDVEPSNCALFSTNDCKNQTINDYCFKKCLKCP